jgi:hypothetical protein
MHRTRYRQLLVDHFHLRGNKSKMRFIEQTGGKLRFLNERGILIYFLGDAANEEELSLLGVCVFRLPDLCFEIITYSITRKFIISTFEMRGLRYGA